MAIKVKARELVFHNGRRYRAGEVFTLAPGYKPGAAMEVLGQVDAPKAEKPKAKKAAVVKEPETFSELLRDAPATPDLI